MKYFLLAVLYLCLVPVYFMLRNETKPKKNIILGVTLPYEARQDQPCWPSASSSCGS